MELDELKKSWQRFGEKMKAPQKDIQELIKNRSEQPLAKLKRRFRKGMLLMPAIASIVIIQFSHKSDFASHVLVRYLLCFCAIMLVYFYVNYRLVSKMESNESDVHSNLLRQTKLLTQLLQFRLLLMRGAVVLFFALVELMMYFRHGDGYESWHARPVIYRLIVYAGTFIFFFFFTRIAMNHRYRKNIRHLQDLVKAFEGE